MSSRLVEAVIATFIAAAAAFAAASEPFSARVVGVTDSDTITVVRDDVSDRNPIRIRLYGIDTPERKQAFYAKAKQHASELAFGHVVSIHPRGRHFDRLVADVILPDGKVLNHEMVRAGLAWWYQKYAPYDRDLKQLESEAQTARRGLWADTDPVAPWQWRRR